MPKGSFFFLSAGKIALGVRVKTPWTNSEIQNIVFKYVLCLADVYSDHFWVIVYYGLRVVAVRTIGEILPFHPDVCLCVFLCRSCTFFFCKISTGQGTYCTLFSPGYVSLNMRRWIRSHPPPLTPPLPHLFVSHCWRRQQPTCVQRSRTASPQCQRKSPGSSPEIKPNWHTN